MLRLLAAAALALGTWAAAPATAATETIDVGVQEATFTRSTRGFYFTAPKAFTITGLDVPTDASTANFDVAVLTFDALNDFRTGSTFTTAFLARDQSTALTGLSIRVAAGETIGILGSRGASAVNSYGAADYASSILGGPVTLSRLIMQGTLRTTDPEDVAQLGSATTEIGRVLVTVAAVPLPAGGVLLVFGLGGLAALRRRD